MWIGPLCFGHIVRVLYSAHMRGSNDDFLARRLACMEQTFHPASKVQEIRHRSMLLGLETVDMLVEAQSVYVHRCWYSRR